jgi:hypothetical protein
MDEAYKELVKRLRDVETRERILGFGGSETLLLFSKEAADALEALAGEVERLKADAIGSCEVLAEGIKRRDEDIAGLVAERDRLKAAITEALNNAQDRLDYDCKCKDCAGTLTTVEGTLREALGDAS